MCRCYVKEKYEVSLKTEFNERKSFFPRRQAEYNKHFISSKIKYNISTIATNIPTELFQNISVKIECKNG